MTTLDEVRKTMNKIIHVNEQDIQLETELKNIKADSLHWVQIIISIENSRDIEIDVDKMRGFVTIGDFVNHIDELCA